MAIHKSLQTVNVGESREMVGGTGSIGTLELLPMELATAPRKDKPPQATMKNFKSTKSRISIPTLEPMLQKNPSFK